MNPTERSLKIEQIQVERKTFTFDLRENDRGRFLRITEQSGNNRDSIMIPAVGLAGLERCLVSMAEANR